MSQNSFISKYRALTAKKKVILLFLALILIAGSIFAVYYFRNKARRNQSKLENSVQGVFPAKTDLIQKQPKSYTLEVSQLNLSAPIILNVDGNNKAAYLAALVNGVAQMSSTALPGEAGNTVIFGHSSYYDNQPGNYKKVFSHLNQLKAGSTINIKSGEQSLNYSVIDNKIVSPSDVSVLAQDKTKKLLTLITCWPPGTIEKRLVVTASLQ